mmetsp:Transcript_18757/g.46933  ORF Transcript_18757/g.46933 Transcript_18757/m.46933 type:complete len:307 (+) Transcript_18757:329-1249(+)
MLLCFLETLEPVLCAAKGRTPSPTRAHCEDSPARRLSRSPCLLLEDSRGSPTSFPDWPPFTRRRPPDFFSPTASRIVELPSRPTAPPRTIDRSSSSRRNSSVWICSSEMTLGSGSIPQLDCGLACVGERLQSELRLQRRGPAAGEAARQSVRCSCLRSTSSRCSRWMAAIVADGAIVGLAEGEPHAGAGLSSFACFACFAVGRRTKCISETAPAEASLAAVALAGDWPRFTDASATGCLCACSERICDKGGARGTGAAPQPRTASPTATYSQPAMFARVAGGAEAVASLPAAAAPRLRHLVRRVLA